MSFVLLFNQGPGESCQIDLVEVNSGRILITNPLQVSTLESETNCSLSAFDGGFEMCRMEVVFTVRVPFFVEGHGDGSGF